MKYQINKINKPDALTGYSLPAMGGSIGGKFPKKLIYRAQGPTSYSRT